jgi:hypothetical protein
MDWYSNSPQNMGKVNRFFVANGLSELRDFTGRNISPFSNMDGEIEDNIEFSDAIGRKMRMAKKRRQKKRDTRRKERISDRKSRRSERQKLLKGASARADRRIKLKETQADTQKELAKTVNQPSATDEALTKALTETPVAPIAPIGSGVQNDPTITTSTGMSKKTKTILIVGGVLVALTATFLIIRKMRKK